MPQDHAAFTLAAVEINQFPYFKKSQLRMTERFSKVVPAITVTGIEI